MKFARLADRHRVAFPGDAHSQGRPSLVFFNSLGHRFPHLAMMSSRPGEITILAYDKRGHGLSDLGDTPYTIADHAADLAATHGASGISNAMCAGCRSAG